MYTFTMDCSTCKFTENNTKNCLIRLFIYLFKVGPCCSYFLVFCVVFFCFVCLRPVSCVPSVASVFVSPSGFSNVYTANDY